jgi:hypothetical protein
MLSLAAFDFSYLTAALAAASVIAAGAKGIEAAATATIAAAEDFLYAVASSLLHPSAYPRQPS